MPAVEEYGIEPIPLELRTAGWPDLFAVNFTFFLNPVMYVLGALAVLEGGLPLPWATGGLADAIVRGARGVSVLVLTEESPAPRAAWRWPEAGGWTGYAAAFCTTAAFVPQVLRVWRTRSTGDISLRMFLVLVTGLCLWLVYGFWRGELPIVVANGATLLLAGTILFFKLRHRDRATATG